MKFIYEPELQEYMAKKGKNAVVVEVISSSSSDFDVTELHVFLADTKRADFFEKKKGYRSRDTECGKVLLPPYRLEYEDTIVFGLKTFLGIKRLTYKGITL